MPLPRHTVLSLVRHLLTAAGGAAVLKGYTDEQTATTVVGALIAGIGGAWGAIDEFLAEQKSRRSPRVADCD